MRNIKLLIVLFFMLLMCGFNIKNVNADYTAQVARVTKCPLSTKASGSCIYSSTAFSKMVTGPYWVDVGDKLTVITSKPEVAAPATGNGSECKDAEGKPGTYIYMKIPYGGKTYYGYTCKNYLWDGLVTDEMKQQFKDAGFYDETYYNSLALMKTAHPSWQFKAVDTKLDFQTAVNGEDNGKKSLLQVTSSVNNQGYLSTKDSNYNYYTDKFTVYDGTNWYAANNATIAYYMDPRNFLNDTNIFQFESIYDNSSSASVDVIKSLLSGNYIEKYAQNFYDAGKQTNVSSVYLASLSRQEIGGTSANIAITGNQFTYGGKTYSGLYNFYNIGATSGSDNLAVYRGLVYANGGTDSSAKSFSRPWNTPEKAILGGAQFIYNNYVNKGQFISYFKKFNTVYYYAKENGQSPYNLYTNQFMQNIQAPKSEAYTTFKSYSDKGRLDTAFVFYIPVYRNMPAKTSLPAKGNPNNYLKTFKYKLDEQAETTIQGFDGAKTEYEFHVDSSVKNVVLTGTTVNSNAKITGLETRTLVTGDNKFTVNVTAQNGALKTYNVNIIKDEPSGDYQYKTLDVILKNSNVVVDETFITGLTLTTKISDYKTKVLAVEPKAEIVVKRDGKVIAGTNNLRTGDTIMLTSGPESQTYSVVLYGDINGDNVINIFDLVKVQKQILKTGNLSGAYFKSADVNKDGKVDVFDLVKVQKYILKTGTISQV